MAFPILFYCIAPSLTGLRPCLSVLYVFIYTTRMVVCAHCSGGVSGACVWRDEGAAAGILLRPGTCANVDGTKHAHVIYICLFCIFSSNQLALAEYWRYMPIHANQTA
jgi:hypothetical protein